VSPRLVPATWAITVEIFFYLLICIGISKTKKKTIIWILFSIFYVIYSFIKEASWGERYFPVAAASLPFSLGAYLFFYIRDYSKYRLLKISNNTTRCLLLLMVVNIIISTVFYTRASGFFFNLGFYGNILICLLLVYAIASGGKPHPFAINLDKKIGSYSYTIYIFHWQVGLLTSYLLFGEAVHEFTEKGLISLVVSLILIIPISYLSIHFIEKPINNKFRKKIKENLIEK